MQLQHDFDISVSGLQIDIGNLKFGSYTEVGR